MEGTLLRTKLYIPPLRPNLVPRRRLIERFNDGLRLGHKLIFISAPAGFGKTTALSEWAAGCEWLVTWLSLDEGDNDLAGFLTYLVSALQMVAPTIGEGVMGVLQTAQPLQTESLLTLLLNEIATLPDAIVLILDDYHLVDSRPVDHALAFLLEHLPPQLHLIIATREDPGLPLARLRARGQLTELRASDLRFSTSEAATFLNQAMGLSLSADDITELESRTEGWIAGLQLAAISMQGHEDATPFIKSFTGSHHFVLDYLIEDVLEQQPEGVQRFLLQTAILKRMTGSLCNALTGREDGGATLERLERANLFIVPLDDERRWYRYHQLFADLLRRRLRQTETDRVLELHYRASTWYEQKGFADEAIEHALRAENFERAAQLVEENFDAVYRRGEHSKLRRWLAGLPTRLVFSRPQLGILHVWNLFSSGQLDAAEQSLQMVEKALDASDDRAAKISLSEPGRRSDSERMRLLGKAAAIRAFLVSYRGDVTGTIYYARRALDCLPEQELTWRSTAAIALGDAYDIRGEMAAAYQTRLEAVATSEAAGDIYLSMIANLKIAITLRRQGQLQRVVEICRRQQQIAEEGKVSQTVAAGWLLAIWGEVLAELNDLERALFKATTGVELTERGRDVAMFGWSSECLVRVFFSRGDLASAAGTIQKIENTARDQDIPPWIMNPIKAWQARIWLAQDKLAAAAQWAVERGLEAGGDPTYHQEVEYIVLARILIAQGRLNEAVLLLQRLLETAESGGLTSRAIEILILQALAMQAGGDSTLAVVTLERALTLAKAGGFTRIFVDEGPALTPLLYKAVTGDVAPEYARQLLSACTVTKRQEIESLEKQIDKAKLIEPLSERELEVLQLIAEGLTNPEIASRLFLSLNTVKVHASNIYGKLGVHNRTQAATRAKELGILPSS